MAAECNKCGQCCNPVTSIWSTKALKTLPPGNEDVEFILANWTELTEEEALKRDPLISPKEGEHYFSCNRFDPTTNLCTAHDERPPVCRGFPFYGGRFDSVPARLIKCSYWLDIDKEKWPEHISPVHWRDNGS